MRPAADTLKTDTLAGGLLILLAMTCVQRFVGFGRAILFCRWLSPEELGQWELTYAFLDLAAPLAVLGIPGTFCRSLEQYRHRGQLKMFLRRTCGAILVLALATASLIVWKRTWFSELLYGRPDRVGPVLLVGLALPFLTFYYSLCELSSGLRLIRASSAIQFVQSFAFAVLGVALVLFWKQGVESVIVAFGGACLLSGLAALIWLRSVWRTTSDDPRFVPQFTFWQSLMPFAASIWVSNWIGNLFLSVDRYLLIHCSGMDAEQALAAAGQYHSARIVPLLLVAVAGLVSTMMIPFLSCDWERGRRGLVSSKINTGVKLTSLTLTAISTLALSASPLLFGWAFGGKYDGGRDLLCWTLMCAVWFAMACVAKTYLWCDKKVMLISVAFGTCLIASVGLNLLLLPRFGLTGAALSACAVNLLALLLIYRLASLRGLQIESGTWVVSILPAALGLGTVMAGVVLGLALSAAVFSELIFTVAQKSQLRVTAQDYIEKLKACVAIHKPAPFLAENRDIEVVYGPHRVERGSE